MSLNDTQYLSKLSHDEMKSVLEKWPNPLIPLACMLGGIGAAGYGLLTHNQGEGSVGSLVGSFAVLILLTLGSSIFGLIKLGRAKKALGVVAEKHALPNNELFKEFRSNLKHIKKL